jgi:hypothetical protein
MKLVIRNVGARPLALVAEPHANEVSLQQGESAAVSFAPGEHNGSEVEVHYGDEIVSVFAPRDQQAIIKKL